MHQIMENQQSTSKRLESPSLDAISLDDTEKSPKRTPKSPNFHSRRESTQQEQSPNSTSPSPLLLAMDQITPLTSRDEDSAIYSDSDVASQNSTVVARGRGATQKEPRSKSKGRGSSRRRKSDSSERSNRSVRSSSIHKDKISPTTKIFRNLLILEESLRQQSQDQRSLRRKFTAFLAILTGLAGFAFYSLYFSDINPSQLVKVMLQFMFFFILITLVLFNLSGEYRRTIIIPRRFFTSTNKGLRQLNLRLVKVKSPITDRIIDWARAIMMSIVQFDQQVLDHTGFFKSTKAGKWVKKNLRILEIRAQPRVGATDVKLVLNPRAFNAEIREAWELYRDEFWAREGSRRRHSISEEQHANKDVLNKNMLLEKHRRERKDRRRSRNDDVQAAALSSGIDLKQFSSGNY